VTTRPVFAGVEAECQPRPLGQQVTTPAYDLPQLCHRGIDVERFPARVATRRAGDSGARDPVRVGSAASDGHALDGIPNRTGVLARTLAVIIVGCSSRCWSHG
jgi:hypothetical protein